MGDLDIDGLTVLGQSACQVGRQRTTRGAFHCSDKLLTLLKLRGVTGWNANPELRGSWIIDNQLQMFTTICHFTSEIFKSPDLRKDETQCV
jgi:hypothetical protein